MKNNKKSLKMAVGTLVSAGCMVSGISVQANPFAATEMTQGYMQLAAAVPYEAPKTSGSNAKAGEMSCGAMMKEKCEMTCGAMMNGAGTKAQNEMLCGAMTDGKMDPNNHEAMKSMCHNMQSKE